MNEMKSKNTAKDTWKLILVFALCLIIPFLLNWILQKKAFVPVIGDEVTWLSFWGTYVGAILTALMVLGTYITIRKTTNMTRTQWRIDWLNSFRNAAADLLVAADDTSVGQLSQDVLFGRYEKAVEAGHLMEVAVRKSSFILSSFLKEYDDVFGQNKGKGFIDKLNTYLEPFLQKTGEIIQFAIICKYLDDKEKEGLLREGVYSVLQMEKDMEEAEYHEIVKAIRSIKSKLEFKDVVHNAIILMQRNCADIDLEGLKSFLLRVGEQNAKYAYGFSLIAVSKKESNEV